MVPNWPALRGITGRSGASPHQFWQRLIFPMSAPKTISPVDAGPSSGIVARRRWGSLLAPYLFLLPTVALLFVFSVVPLVSGLWMSFYDFAVVHGRPTFVAFQNYWRFLHGSQFCLRLLNTVCYTLR